MADTIRVYGLPFAAASPYYSRFLVTVTNNRTGSCAFIPLRAGGYEPKISFPHLTHTTTPNIYI